MSLTILADENIPGVQAQFGALGEVRTVSGRAIDAQSLSDIDVLLVRSVTPVNAALLQGTPVRFVGTATSGVEHVDRAYLASQNVGFAHAPGANANSVVEYVLAAIAASGNSLEQLLDGASVGIVGYGYIGRALLRRLRALGVACQVYDPWLPQGDIPGATSLEAVLDCQVVTLHCELVDTPPWPSRHLMGAPQLRCLRDDALLINASRGAVVDNQALLAALTDGQARFRTVIDVWEGEPQPMPALLQRVELATAHIAGYSYDGKLAATAQLREALEASAASIGISASVFHGSNAVAISPEPARAVSLTPANQPCEFLRQLLCARYDILQDDALLRGALLGSDNSELSQQAAGHAFDQLRKQYRCRRELSGSTIALVDDQGLAMQTSALSETQRHLLEALECRWDDGGEY